MPRTVDANDIATLRAAAEHGGVWCPERGQLAAARRLNDRYLLWDRGHAIDCPRRCFEISDEGRRLLASLR